MATQKQIDANRRNAQKSTGPVTTEGKQKSRFNSVKHGMTSEVAVLLYEDRHSYEQMRDSIVASYQPVGAGEEMLVELVAVNYWRMLRVRRIETASFDLHLAALKEKHGVSTRPTLDDDGGLASAFAQEKDTFKKLERYQTAVERSYYRSIEALRKLQATRHQEERRQSPPQKIGFVSKTSVPYSEWARQTPQTEPDYDFPSGANASYIPSDRHPFPESASNHLEITPELTKERC